jgi:hypothetical protein
MAKRHIPISLATVLDEAAAETPRAAILVGGSLVEYALTELLQRHLRSPQNAEERQYRPGEREIASTFSEKIWLAYFMGLIGPHARKDLDRIRNIRNECAHNMNPISFGEGEVAKHCKELRLGRKTIPPFGAPNHQEIFMATVKALTSGMFLRATTVSFARREYSAGEEDRRFPSREDWEDWVDE